METEEREYREEMDEYLRYFFNEFKHLFISIYTRAVSFVLGIYESTAWKCMCKKRVILLKKKDWYGSHYLGLDQAHIIYYMDIMLYVCTYRCVCVYISLCILFFYM